MKTPTTNPLLITGISQYSPFRHFLVTAAMLLLLTLERSNAGVLAEWQANPMNGNWNNSANWSPSVPNGPSDTAFFEPSSITSVSISANTQAAGIVFDSGASAFTITATPALTLTISGNGITNNSGITQNFVTAANGTDEGGILFKNSATAGSTITFTNNGGTVSNAGGGFTDFFNTSTAGSGTFTNKAGTVSGAFGGETDFVDTSTAGSGTFTNNAGTVSGAFGSETDFFDTSTAGSGTFTNNGAAFSGIFGGRGITRFFSSSTADNGTFTNNGGTVSGALGGLTVFSDQSTAGNGTLIANGGVNGAAGGAIFFENDPLGGTSRVEVFGNGNMEMSFHSAPGMAVGSIEGNGIVFLGANKLTVGGNKLSTTFSGVMQDGGGNGGTGGSLTKTGKGKLSLTNANTYTGGTTIKAGSLLVKNKTGSATDTGGVQVNAGTLGGTGKIAGAVTVGNGTSSGAILLAGNSATSPGTLTVNNTLTFLSLSTYECVLNRTKTKASKVSAVGVTIDSNVPFTFVDTGTGTLAVGTIFTVINNTSANPIFGTFSNLPDGSTLTSNGNKFKARYTGGTGNDLTLKVVP